MATIFGALPYILQNGTVADATQVMADFNKVISDGNANAAENGVNSSITALLGLTTPIPIAGGSSTHFIGTTSGGSANAQTVATTTPVNWALTSGFMLSFRPGFSNTGAMTLAVAGGAALAVRKATPSGPAPLVAGDVIAGQNVTVVYDGTAYLRVSDMAYPALFAAQATLASAATTDLGTIGSHNIQITGITTITSFGSTALTSSPIYILEFASSLTLTYNATSLLLPGGNNIITKAGDSAIVCYLGSGNWQVLHYQSGLLLPNVQPPPGSFKNLVVTVSTDTVLAVTADALTLQDVSGRTYLATSVSLSNTITGTGANGLDTGTLTVQNFYYVYAIFNPSTNTLASLVSLSPSSPTLPSGYTFFMRVGAVFYATTGRLWRTIQRGRTAQLITGTFPVGSPAISSGSVGTYNSTSPTLSSVSLTGFVPTTAAKVIVYAFNNWKNNSLANVLIASSVGIGGTNNGPQGSNGTVYPVYLNSLNLANVRAEIVLEGSSLAIAADNTGHVTALGGWEDNI